jgi:hypothetical protein
MIHRDRKGVIQRTGNYREEFERNDTEEKEGMVYRIR